MLWAGPNQSHTSHPHPALVSCFTASSVRPTTTMVGSTLHLLHANKCFTLLPHSLHGLHCCFLPSAKLCPFLSVTSERNSGLLRVGLIRAACSKSSLRNVRRSEGCGTPPFGLWSTIKVRNDNMGDTGEIETTLINGVSSCNPNKGKEEHGWTQHVPLAILVGFPNVVSFAEAAYANSSEAPAMVYGEIGAVLEFGVQFLYLGALLALLGIGSFLVVRQVLVRRELETAAKDLQERVRTGQASPLEYFELGAVLLRKKFFPLATKYLEQAIQKWDGDVQDLAQVYNALGFSYANDGKIDKAIVQYEKAVKLQPGYVVAWNNLGDAYEKKKDLRAALRAYEEALLFDPNNRVARTCRDALKERVDRLKGVPINLD